MIHSLLAFADSMAAQLDQNSHKGDSWRQMTAGEHLRRLKQEVGELTRAMKRKEPPHRIRREAADVANFAMFLVEVYQDEQS